MLPEKAAEMRAVTGAGFQLLNDPQGRVMDYFGLRHAGANPDNPELDIPQAASFLFSPSGKLIWSKVAENYRVRPKPREILNKARDYLASLPEQF